jgi:hypothetical protein
MVAPKYLQIHLPGNMVSQPRRQQSSTQYWSLQNYMNSEILSLYFLLFICFISDSGPWHFELQYGNRNETDSSLFSSSQLSVFLFFVQLLHIQYWKCLSENLNNYFSCLIMYFKVKIALLFRSLCIYYISHFLEYLFLILCQSFIIHYCLSILKPSLSVHLIVSYSLYFCNSLFP